MEGIGSTSVLPTRNKNMPLPCNIWPPGELLKGPKEITAKIAEKQKAENDTGSTALKPEEVDR